MGSNPNKSKRAGKEKGDFYETSYKTARDKHSHREKQESWRNIHRGTQPHSIPEQHKLKSQWGFTICPQNAQRQKDRDWQLYRSDKNIQMYTVGTDERKSGWGWEHRASYWEKECSWVWPHWKTGWHSPNIEDRNSLEFSSSISR